MKFYDQLCETTEDLSQLKYTVLALGSRDYPKFCAAGHLIDEKLASKGAQRLLPLVELDASSSDKGEGAFESWAPSAVMALGFKMPEITVKSTFSFKHSTNPEDPIHKQPLQPLGFEWGVMLSNTVLTPDGFNPTMHRYQIKLPVGMTYEAGDHVAILAQNNPETVKSVITALHLKEDEILDVETTLPEGFNIIPEKVTVKQLFSQYLDLNGIPSRNLIRVFRQVCTNQFKKEDLSLYLDPSQPRYYSDLTKDTSIGEFIIEFSSYGIPSLEAIVSATPQIRPRLYSIASAPENTVRSIDLIITDVQFGPGGTRNGLCTSFLKRFGLTKVAIHCQKGCFGYPTDPSAPMIMAALGCGIAPMLSLLQHRENLSGKIGNAALFFGCRYRNTYPILDSILQNYVEIGSMQDLYVAYSREGTTKTYITDLMMSNPDVVWKYWSNPKTEYYYCGPARGIPDQLHDILVQITMDKGHMTREEAEAFCAQHPHHVESF